MARQAIAAPNSTKLGLVTPARPCTGSKRMRMDNEAVDVGSPALIAPLITASSTPFAPLAVLTHSLMDTDAVQGYENEPATATFRNYGNPNDKIDRTSFPFPQPRATCDTVRTACFMDEPATQSPRAKARGRWTEAEHQTFLEALR